MRATIILALIISTIESKTCDKGYTLKTDDKGEKYCEYMCEWDTEPNAAGTACVKKDRMELWKNSKTPTPDNVWRAVRYRTCEKARSRMKDAPKAKDCAQICGQANKLEGKNWVGYSWMPGKCWCCSSIDADVMSKSYKGNSVFPTTFKLPPKKHDLIAEKTYCGDSKFKEFKAKNLDVCQELCYDYSHTHQVRGYWWKAWGGGYCGCCEKVDKSVQTKNWPDATLYQMPYA